MTQLQKIVAKAKTLRKSYPNAKWTDLIKKASKLVTPAKKSVSGIKRTVVKKYAPVKPLVKKRIETKSDFAMAGIKKKKATKKAVKKSPARSLHKDTKSHNVRISVMSGVNTFALSQIERISKAIEKNNLEYIKLSKSIKDNWFKKDKILLPLAKKRLISIKKDNIALKKSLSLFKTQIK